MLDQSDAVNKALVHGVEQALQQQGAVQVVVICEHIDSMSVGYLFADLRKRVELVYNPLAQDFSSATHRKRVA